MTQRIGTLGIDIGGTKTRFTLFDDKFRVVDELKMKTRADKNRNTFTGNLSAAVKTMMKIAGKKTLSIGAVGVGCAGSIDGENGTLRNCPNIPFLEGYPLRKRLSKLAAANVLIANDVHAGLYGEHQLGAAIGLKHVLGIFIGTGIGGAIIINGSLYLGANGCTGNIGHYLMHPVGPLTGSRREGVLDAIASRIAIAGEAATLAAKQWAPHLYKKAGTDVSEIKSTDLAAAIRKGDREIESLVRSRSRIVGLALSNMVDFLNPEMIVLGGGLIEAMPHLVRQEVKAAIDENSTSEAKRGLRVAVAKLGGRAVTAGAAKLAHDAFIVDQKA
jgi:glucokinase